MGYKFWTGAHTKHRLVYHVVWVPKRRKRVLTGIVGKKLKHYIYEATKMNMWWVEELKIMPDHVHILIQIHPDEKLSKVVKILKGGSSKMLKKDLSDLDEFVWGDNFWARGYYAETVGVSTFREVKKYIKENRESMPH